MQSTAKKPIRRTSKSHQTCTMCLVIDSEGRWVVAAPDENADVKFSNDFCDAPLLSRAVYEIQISVPLPKAALDTPAGGVEVVKCEMQ